MSRSPNRALVTQFNPKSAFWFARDIQGRIRPVIAVAAAVGGRQSAELNSGGQFAHAPPGRRPLEAGPQDRTGMQKASRPSWD